MKNNCFIKKSDYENYKIPISIQCIFPKYRKKYIYDELEKIHPCFSDDFCYFSKNNFSEKGIFSDIVVIHKSKISEYISKFGKQTFNLEGIKKRKIKIKKSHNFLFFLVVFMFLVAIGVYVIFINSNFSNIETQKIDENNNMTTSNVLEASYETLSEIDWEKFIGIIKAEKGFINSLDWKLNTNGETINAKIEKIFPEKIQNNGLTFNIPQIDYYKGVPTFQCLYENIFQINNSDFLYESVSDYIKMEIRNLIMENGGIIKLEISNPYELIIESDYKEKNNETFFLGKLNNELEKNNIWAQFINIVNNNNKIELDIGLTKEPAYKNEVLKILSNNINLFFNDEIVKHDDGDQNKALTINETINNKGYEVVGQIGKGKRNKTLFFINEKGKIEKRNVYGEK